MTDDQYRCEFCGRWLDPDADDVFFDREDPGDECSYVVPFCDETCHGKWEDRKKSDC